MPSKIEDYAMIGDCQTAALVGRDGSIDWLCLPRFDSAACFASLLGTPDNGRWLLAPANQSRHVRRQYRDDTLILETRFETDDGVVDLIDFMPLRSVAPMLVRIVKGVSGKVPLQMELRLRFDYGRIVPWVQSSGNTLQAIAGPDAVRLQSDVALRGENLTTVATFDLAEGDSVSFCLSWYESYREAPGAVDTAALLNATEKWWREWSARSTYRGKWRSQVTRSLITLQALTYEPTGGMVAAPTTSLPERIGGSRNWDYRFCWLRDATMTLLALESSGYIDEAVAWRKWLLRAAAGNPADLQIAYGIRGEHGWTSLRSIGSKDTGTLSPCASAMRRVSSFSSTSTANSWTPCSSRALPVSRRNKRPGTSKPR